MKSPLPLLKELLIVLAVMTAIAVWGILSHSHGAVITTYAKRYSDSARVHSNRRYHPDSMNVAVGWRELYGAHLLIITDRGDTAHVTATDCMNKRYDGDVPLHVDASPAVMKALGLEQRAEVTVLVDIEWLMHGHGIFKLDQ